MAHQYTAWAFAQGIRGSGRKFVLVALADCANGDGYAYPGQTTLADMTGQSERSVREHVEWLEEQGYVRRAPRRRKDGSRTSDGYYLPPIDSTGRIRRWDTTGSSRRLMEGQESPDQDDANPLAPTGKSRRLSASRSTGRFRTGHRQNLPVDTDAASAPSSTAQTPAYQPAESAGHEPLTTREPSDSSSVGSSNTPTRNPPEEEGRPKASFKEPAGTSLDLTPSDASVYRQGRGRGQTDSHLPTFHPEVFKQLVTFRKLHGPKATDEMFRAWATKVRHHISDHGEPKVLAALEATIGNFPRLKLPFAFFEACLKRPARPTADGDLPTADDFRTIPSNADLLGVGGNE